MVEIKGIFEVALRVADLAASEAFYCGVLGLESGLRQDERKWHFLWLRDRSGMVVLQEEPGEWPLQHFAFTLGAADLDKAAQTLRERGVAVTDPVTHDWMNARSVYFVDPDGHQLEFCAPLG